MILFHNGNRFFSCVGNFMVVRSRESLDLAALQQLKQVNEQNWCHQVMQITIWQLFLRGPTAARSH